MWLGTSGVTTRSVEPGVDGAPSRPARKRRGTKQLTCTLNLRYDSGLRVRGGRYVRWTVPRRGLFTTLCFSCLFQHGTGQERRNERAPCPWESVREFVRISKRSQTHSVHTQARWHAAHSHSLGPSPGISATHPPAITVNGKHTNGRAPRAVPLRAAGPAHRLSAGSGRGATGRIYTKRSPLGSSTIRMSPSK